MLLIQSLWDAPSQGNRVPVCISRKRHPTYMKFNKSNFLKINAYGKCVISKGVQGSKNNCTGCKAPTA